MIAVIRRDVLQGIMEAASRYYPKEFFCLLGGRIEGDTTYVDEIVFIPFKSSHRSAIFDLNHIPMDSRIVGSAHSHPSPSGASPVDRRSFIRTGWVHIIVFPPFSENSFYAYDGKGRLISVRIV